MKQLFSISLLWFLFAGTGPANASPAELSAVQQQASTWLKAQTDHIGCRPEHFIYGVGYKDGSYMERIFYVAEGGVAPLQQVTFRDDSLLALDAGADFSAAPFVLEIKAPRSLHATPQGSQWLVTDEGWVTAMRFKYTNWFGEISRQQGVWEVVWHGYRRPMLPPALLQQGSAACAIFADH